MGRLLVGAVTDFPEGLTAISVGGVDVALARVDDSFYALEDSCSHEDCPLSEGVLEGRIVICPCHGSEFDLTSGDALSLPAVEPVRAFAVVPEGSSLYLVLAD
jgi:nitrite reductase/ring-hydroxylating ferredoxin subunit